jgi:EAL domain-containing protein (putative c-di-GMP-specific phosphodiesterase class I)
MDDFGSGYSTLNALKDFDFDELKIDMEFLNRFGEKSKTILASVVDMAKKLGIQTLAEGVETKEQADFLLSKGCPAMQGYYFHKPMPVSDYEKLCNAQNLSKKSSPWT